MKTNKLSKLIFTFSIMALLILSIKFTPLSRKITLENNHQEISIGDLNISSELTFDNNGSVVSNAAGSQTTPEICSDGAKGVIIIWTDTRSRTSDIYGQRINGTGDFLWGDNGTAICTTRNPTELHTISDGAGGAIVVWKDGLSTVYAQKVNSTGDPQWNANGVLVHTGTNVADLRICRDESGGVIASWDTLANYRVYAQRINSTGHAVWTVNGVAAADNLIGKLTPRICSDGAGGAIINWRHNTNSYMYAQRINSTGGKEWGVDGLVMTSSTQGQYFNEIESDGAGGAYIVWSQDMSAMSIIGQHVNSSGAISWSSGTHIGYGWGFSKNQYYAKLCSDGAGGVFIIWKDAIYYDIHAQRLKSDGNLAWGYPQERYVCSVSGDEYWYEISYDGFGGALIVWSDSRSGGWDIYAQGISASGELRWEVDGKLICNAINTQNSPEIINGEEGGAFITWQDSRNGGWDVYAQRIENEDPTSNSPTDITTSIESSVTINWRLYDDYGSSEYRVIANNTLGDFYVWQNWTSWSNNTALNVPINRTEIGVFDYTIEYRDKSGKFGEPSKVIVTLLSDILPTSSHPSQISTGAAGSELIPWTLYDDYGGGQYRVLANDTNGDFYVWRDWASWTNDTPTDVPINRNDPGIFNYTIEYYDIYNQFGNPDTVIVTVINELPVSSSPDDRTIEFNQTISMGWVLTDDFGTGDYRILVYNSTGGLTISTDWTPWFNGVWIQIPVNNTLPGAFTYTIDYYDSHNQFGVLDSVVVTVEEPLLPPAPPAPEIPFGNFYLVFTCLGVVTLIIVKKRRIEP